MSQKGDDYQVMFVFVNNTLILEVGLFLHCIAAPLCTGLMLHSCVACKLNIQLFLWLLL